jgi:hypothetical protein
MTNHPLCSAGHWYSPHTWVTVEARDMGNSLMIMGTQEVPQALEASNAHGPKNSVHRRLSA